MLSHKSILKAVLGSTAASAGAFMALTAHAVPILDPGSFSSLGALPSGSFTIDTDVNSFGGVVISQGGSIQTNLPQAANASNSSSIDFFAPPDVLVLTFDGGSTLASGSTITVTGDRALALLFKGDFTLAGEINVNGGDGGPSTIFAGSGGTAGAGGYSGGRGSGACSGDQPGAGPGGGGDGRDAGSTSGRSGGGGGGHGSAGGTGTSGGGLGTGAPGAANGDLTTTLQGGSGGGGGAGVCSVVFAASGGGGGGGGALEIGALNTLLIDGAIHADGGDGGFSQNARGGGGGAGGGVRLHGFDLELNGLISASGGLGMSLGGCGGGGRVLIGTNTQGGFTNNGTVDVSTGALNCAGTGVTGDFQTLTSSSIGEDPSSSTNPPPTGIPVPGSLVLLLSVILGWATLRRRA